MSPRFGLARRDYDLLKKWDWPDYDELLNLEFSDLPENNIKDKIIRLINNEPKYHQSLLPLLKFQFLGVGSITEHYSQAWQDMFVLTMLDGKRDGTYLEIGAGDPTDINNTYLLEQFGWSGINIDLVEDARWSDIRPTTQYVVADARSIDYVDLLKDMPKQIDYLQVDIEPVTGTLEALKKLPHSKYRFSVITYETDAYLGDIKTRDESRDFLTSLGYKLIVNDVAVKDNGFKEWVPFEDWYIDPTVVNPAIYQKIEVHQELTLPHQIFLGFIPSC